MSDKFDAGAIVLAAGKGRRFGKDKRQAMLADGKTLLRQSVENVLRAFNEVLVVLREDDITLEQNLIHALGTGHDNLRTLKTRQAAGGMGHSLASAILEVRWPAAFIFLGDMPHIRHTTLDQLKLSLAAHRDRHPIILPTHAGHRGHPVCFDQAYFTELAQLSGDQGARSIIHRHRDRVIEVPVQDSGISRDVDRPADLSTG